MSLGIKTAIVIAVVLVIVTRTLVASKKRFGDCDKAAPGEKEAPSLPNVTFMYSFHFSALSQIPLYRPIASNSPDRAVTPPTRIPLKTHTVHCGQA